MLDFRVKLDVLDICVVQYSPYICSGHVRSMDPRMYSLMFLKVPVFET
jgi:hypothetical protein